MGRVVEGGAPAPAPGLRLPGLALMDVNEARLAVEGLPSLEQCGAVIVAPVEGPSLRDTRFQHQQGRGQWGL